MSTRIIWTAGQGRQREKCSGHFYSGRPCTRYATVWRDELGVGMHPRPFCNLHNPEEYLNPKDMEFSKQKLLNRDVPSPHPDADPDEAAKLNIEHYRRLAEQRHLNYRRGLNIPSPHPDADPDRAAELNIEQYRRLDEERHLDYERKLAAWEALTPEEQQVTLMPTPPLPIADELQLEWHAQLRNERELAGDRALSSDRKVADPKPVPRGLAKT